MPIDSISERARRNVLILFAAGCAFLDCFNFSPRYSKPREPVVTVRTYVLSPEAIERMNRAFSRQIDAANFNPYATINFLGR
ncbi:MAG: hypothetical protein NT076_02265 [Candidatus Pacearchaeota archaeon]|nr:hypothetical protein [Candidatus Pacearchaeota archaeon]